MGNQVLIKTSFFTDFYLNDLLCCQMIYRHCKKAETMDSNNKKPKHSIVWRDQPESHDYPAASSYLCLLLPPSQVEKLLSQLQVETITQFKAKDIFRAAQLPLLDEHNFHVARDLSKIEQSKALSPLLLVRDLGKRHLIIADGYHRLCAVYLHDEDALIPCQIISLTVQDLANV